MGGGGKAGKRHIIKTVHTYGGHMCRLCVVWCGVWCVVWLCGVVGVVVWCGCVVVWCVFRGVCCGVVWRAAVFLSYYCREDRSAAERCRAGEFFFSFFSSFPFLLVAVFTT